ncbi:MAG: hypothetical protein JWQ17_3736, partial [Tardiphaga sp.]|nr:hypothetical protein [Tardiphaga sp.]
SDYFTYRTSDGNASSNIATVTINVTNSPLIAASDAYSATEDAPLVVAAAGGVLANDADLDPAATLITATVVTNAGHGTVSLAADGSFTYTPDADFYGTDSFTYQASDNAGNPPVVATVTINVAPVNDAPVLSPHAPADVSYVENAAPTALFASEAVTDADNPANFNGGSLTVAIASGFQTGDQIALLAASGFSVVAGHLHDGAVDLGTVTSSASSFSVQLSALATPAEVNRLATAFGFSNTTENPGSVTRVITLTFNDGGNVGGPGSELSDSVSQTVHVTPVDDAPVVNAGHTASYGEQAAPVVIDGGMTVTDADSTSLTKATVTITDFVAGDTLAAPSGAGISIISNNNGVLVLSLTGSTAPADYQALLRQITFANSANDDPTLGGTQPARTISWVVTDDTGLDSAAVTSTVTVTAINDAPTEIVPADLHSPAGSAVVITGVSFSDPDDAGKSETATFTALSTGAATNGTFTALNNVGLTHVTVTGSASGTVTLTGALADINDYITNGYLTFTQPSPTDSRIPVVTDISVVINDLGNTGAGAQSSAVSHITVTGNSPPSVPTGSGTGSVEEGAAAGTPVGLVVQSTDADNDTLTYSIVGHGAAAAFQIDANGVISVRDGSLIDYESNPTHASTITVLVSDGKGGTSTADFVINVTDRAPTVPADANGATGGSISEGAVNGNTVGITASSSDINGGAVTYSLGDNAGGRFAINATTGVVTVANASLLDFETATSHKITVVASDGTLTSSQDFTIAVTDVAPTAPADGDGVTGGSVSEGAVRGDAVGITASSSDIHGGTVTYSLTDDAGGRFTIDGSTGVVTVADASLLDFETATSHQITVVASDGTLTSSRNFTIAVTDVAPTPPADSDGAAGGSVREDASSGDPVGITASSSDIHGGTVTYSLTDNAGGRFTIDGSTGVVTVANAALLDFETATAHQITISASDGTLATTQNFTIAVVDVPPTPAIDTNAAVDTVVEGASNGTVVGVTAFATDIHGGKVTYSLSPGSANLGFAIDATTGVVTVNDASKVDFESSGGHYDLTVRTSDPSGAFSEHTFTIAVTDAAPVAGADAFTTDEDMPLVVTAANGLLANDSDINGGALTAVLDSGPAHGTLQLNADGSFRYLSSQDYNGTDSFTYHTSDGTLPSGTVTVSLTINPVNDAPVVDAGNTLSFNANTGQPVVIDAAITMHDVDNTTLASAKVAVTGGFEPGNDSLGFVNGNGITGSYNSATGVLTLTGVASVADYQAALASVSFMSITQSNGTRTIQWTADDGSAQFSQSLPANSTIAVSGIIVPPHVFSDNRGTPTTPNVTQASLVFDTTSSGPLVPPSSGDGFGTSGSGGFGYHVVHTDAVLTTASDATVQINLALAALEAPLGGDIAYVVARQANGDPLPDWLKFDPATGTFAGLPPDNAVASIEPDQSDSNIVTGALPPNPDLGTGPGPNAPVKPQTITVEVLARDSKGNVAVTTFTIDLRAHPAGKQGWNVQPFGPTRHASLATLSPELAAIEAAVRDATPSFEPFAARGMPVRHGDAISVGSGEAMPAGRAGLTEQLASIGWRSMDAQRNALLASLQRGR